ncbi:hypothetical protein [Vibrio sp. V39_P1S14PM300]|uniref:hypothetical protein n=1 Tax=Vibrio sp. V39_P1S14PM300 TaxID=1938690 RepID=UPI00137302C3|nr:hypothetical protein [Vibrio sp. V39_P1S14PM300]NAX20989.1 hypothetical protein [Vibrio sp. V39_P1S14PM300]
MYRTIQVNASYKIERLGPNGLIGPIGKLSCGQLRVLIRGGDAKNFPFGGFLDADNVIGLQRVKVIDVKALCIDDEAQDAKYAIPSHHYVVGAYMEQKVYLLLYEGEIRHYPLKHLDTDRTNNVVTLL